MGSGQWVSGEWLVVRAPVARTAVGGWGDCCRGCRGVVGGKCGEAKGSF